MSLADDVAALLDDLLADEGMDVEYARGGDGVAGGVRAVPARTELPADDIEARQGAYERKDWLLRAAHLVINGNVTEPQIGDLITATFNGVEKTYKVLPVAEQCFSYLDHREIGIRMHTIRVT